ncbi:MAG: sulfur carrier protein ThiS [Aquificae bacterium]|nr:sulfur carrier protein ThiS [Aquificota bacterium]
MPKIVVNGQEREIPRELTVMELLSELGVKYREVGLAVAVNEEIVPKSEYEKKVVRDGDRVEVVQLVGGG